MRKTWPSPYPTKNDCKANHLQQLTNTDNSLNTSGRTFTLNCLTAQYYHQLKYLNIILTMNSSATSLSLSKKWKTAQLLFKRLISMNWKCLYGYSIPIHIQYSVSPTTQAVPPTVAGLSMVKRFLPFHIKCNTVNGNKKKPCTAYYTQKGIVQ